MLINIVGNVGSGKTLMAVILSVYFNKKTHVDIHSNIHFYEIPYSDLSIANLISQQISHAVILLDEAYTYIHSRNSMSNGNQMFGTVLFQSRKTDLILILTEQIQRSIDVYYRDLCDLTITCVNCVSYFEYDFLFHKQNVHFKMRLHIKTAQKYFDLYDTTEIVSDNSAKQKAIVFSAMSPEQRQKYIDNLASTIIDNYSEKEKITLKDIKNYLMINDLKASFANLIFESIKVHTEK